VSRPKLHGPSLRGSASVALLGVIGLSIVAVIVEWRGTEIAMEVITDRTLTEDEVEDFEVAGTELLADFPVATRFRLTITVAGSVGERLRPEIVFLRHGAEPFGTHRSQPMTATGT
jgi:hypothetical protein